VQGGPGRYALAPMAMALTRSPPVSSHTPGGHPLPQCNHCRRPNMTEYEVGHKRKYDPTLDIDVAVFTLLAIGQTASHTPSSANSPPPLRLPMGA
jgi:hypothetical protein